ncbi:cytochrome P450 [Catenulispora pinisilvae]|uniref:cytochrome P450 n=1 Tax=Catenulispora pinisilvae TaxID=2705253 RepID=UPI0018923704|nr:cytochrome P450 [Catenulispora pinisilvae]
MTDTDRIPDLPALPFPSHSLTPPAEYAERRARCPFGQVRLPSGDPAILLLTYRDVAAAMAEPLLSHDLTGPDAPRMTAEPSFLQDPDIVLNKDGADHLRLRRIVAAAFTPRRAERWKPVIRQVASELIDDLEKAGPPTDLVAGYCFALPVRIICRLLGVPEHDALRFRLWSNAFAAGARMTPEQVGAEIGAFLAYMAELLAAKRAEPGEDLIDDLIAARDGADKLSEQELLTLATGLIAAGNETTATALSRALAELLDGERTLWKQLLDQPNLLPAAVEELLRFTGLSNSTLLRRAVADVELPSGTVRAGQTIALPHNGALRDPEAYPDPDTIRFDRDAPPTLIFGGGPHYCLGAHLAKAELTIGLEMLLQRLPTLRMAVARDELEFSGGEIVDSMIALPAAW